MTVLYQNATITASETIKQQQQSLQQHGVRHTHIPQNQTTMEIVRATGQGNAIRQGRPGREPRQINVPIKAILAPASLLDGPGLRSKVPGYSRPCLSPCPWIMQLLLLGLRPAVVLLFLLKSSFFAVELLLWTLMLLRQILLVVYLYWDCCRRNSFTRAAAAARINVVVASYWHNTSSHIMIVHSCLNCCRCNCW